jgi:hypothetical protein
VPGAASAFKIRVAARIEPQTYSSSGEPLPVQARRLTNDLRKIFLQEPPLADA